ncbi:MAG TPA: spermidine synthase [Rubrivivax sp.]|nr:spermidine synthase [Rubrivivax sp.]
MSIRKSRTPGGVEQAAAPASASASAFPPVTISEHDGVRFLHLGSAWVQGAMRLRKPDRIELDYVQRMLASLLWLPPEALDDGLAVQLGLGAAAITRFTQQQLGMHTIAVELNPLVIQAARLWFGLPVDGPRLQVLRMDALHWLQQEAQPGSVRLLHVDLYDEEAAAPVLDDERFYAACRRALTPGGVMAVNLFGRDASFDASAARIAAVFGTDQVWSLRPTREGNTVVVAGRGVLVPGREALRQRAAAIETRHGRLGLKARDWLRMVRPWQPRALPRAPAAADSPGAVPA